MKLQFTNGYRPHFDQISRIMQILSTQEGRNKILHKDIVEAIGLSERQVKNLISMMTGFGLVNPRVSTLTDFGKTITLNDPYFEKIETLWIIHYIVSCNPEWVVWHRIINTVIPELDNYEIESISKKYFSDLEIHVSEKTIKEKLPTEVGCVLAAYARTSFSNLNIIQEHSNGKFIKTEPVAIPCMAFLFCIEYFKNFFSPGTSALNIMDICQAQNSPGMVFNMPEYRVRELLENIHESDLMRVEKFGNLDQVRFYPTLSQGRILERIYGG